MSPDAFDGIGAEVAAAEMRPCPWVFDRAEEMVAFCMGLFGMKDCPPQLLADAMHERIGVQTLADGRVQLDWRLLYIDLVKPA